MKRKCTKAQKTWDKVTAWGDKDSCMQVMWVIVLYWSIWQTIYSSCWAILVWTKGEDWSTNPKTNSDTQGLSGPFRSFHFHLHHFMIHVKTSWLDITRYRRWIIGVTCWPSICHYPGKGRLHTECDHSGIFNLPNSLRSSFCDKANFLVVAN